MHTQKSRAAADGKKLKLKRLTIDLTAQEHRILKGQAAKAGLTMREMVLEVLREKGLIGRTRRGASRRSADPNATAQSGEAADE